MLAVLLSLLSARRDATRDATWLAGQGEKSDILTEAPFVGVDNVLGA